MRQVWLGKLQGWFGESSPPRAAQGKRKSFRTAEENAQILKLARVLSSGDSELMTEVEASVNDPTKYFQTYAAAREFASHENDIIDPLFAAYAALLRHQYIGSIDWKADLDELRETLQPLLQRQGLSDFDWSFVNDLERAENWEALRNENLLNEIGSRLRERGRVFMLLDMGWDSYDLAILSPAEFEKIHSVRGEGFRVTDRFD